MKIKAKMEEKTEKNKLATVEVVRNQMACIARIVLVDFLSRLG